ncbi:hypothetical protein V1498_16190 [Peribacillus sp. SCS-26]|uniref:hypothetical protein n=1 Tax=Paraperibacillus marinus TaxID=3115295 RepID=UPI003906A057
MNSLLSRCLNEQRNLEIIYLAEDQGLSQRRITLLEMTDTHIKAFCFLRNQKRTFKIANILSAIPARSTYHAGTGS